MDSSYGAGAQLKAAGLFRSILRELLDPPKRTTEEFIQSQECCLFYGVHEQRYLCLVSTRQKQGSRRKFFALPKIVTHRFWEPLFG